MFNKGRGMGLALVALLIGVSAPAHAGDDHTLFASLGDATRAPIGWIEFCADNAADSESRTRRMMGLGVVTEVLYPQREESMPVRMTKA